jgi:hypothetical protein
MGHFDARNILEIMEINSLLLFVLCLGVLFGAVGLLSLVGAFIAAGYAIRTLTDHERRLKDIETWRDAKPNTKIAMAVRDSVESVLFPLAAAAEDVAALQARIENIQTLAANLARGVVGYKKD